MRKNLEFKASASALLLTLFLLPGIARTADVSVGCAGGTGGTYPSISAALAAIGQTGPSTISVTGTCTENVNLNFVERITIVAGPAGAKIVGPPNSDVFDILRSRAISLVNLEIVGNPESTTSGSGVVFNFSSRGQIVGCNIHDNRGNGVTVNDYSAPAINNTTIQNNTPGTGLAVTNHSSVSVTGTTIQNNGVPATGGIGVFVSDGSSVAFNQKNFILGNGDSGIFAQALSSVRLNGRLPDLFTTIQGHNSEGIGIVRVSHLDIAGPHLITANGSACPLNPVCGGIFAMRDSTVNVASATVSGNHGSGVSVQQGANLVLSGATISRNSGDGVHLELNSIGNFFAGNTIAGNGRASVSCDERSLIIGDLTGIPTEECAHPPGGTGNLDVLRGFF